MPLTPIQDRDNLTEASSWEECLSGETCSLIEVPGGKTFMPAVMSAGKGRLLTCRNDTNSRSNLGIVRIPHFPHAQESYPYVNNAGLCPRQRC